MFGPLKKIKCRLFGCQLLSGALGSDRFINRYNKARKASSERWCQLVLPLNTQQFSERSRGIRVAVYTLKIVTMPNTSRLKRRYHQLALPVYAADFTSTYSQQIGREIYWSSLQPGEAVGKRCVIASCWAAHWAHAALWSTQTCCTLMGCVDIPGAFIRTQSCVCINGAQTWVETLSCNSQAVSSR